MIYKKSRKIILGIGIIVSFALLITAVTIYFNFQLEQRKASTLTHDEIESMSVEELRSHIIDKRASQPKIHGFYFIPLIGFFGLIIGTLVYYIMSDKVMQKNKTLKKNTTIILNFLTEQEKAVVKTLMENNGKVQQYELSHLPNLNKLRTHRILAALERKKIIHKEKLGKVNRIVLNQELYDVLKD